MSTLKNKVMLIGNVGKEPEIISLESGRKLAKFSMATDENYKNGNNERITETQWHNVVAWGATAELIEKYVDKGKEIGVEGKLTTRSWDDKEGQRHYRTEVVCHELLLLAQK